MKTAFSPQWNISDLKANILLEDHHISYPISHEIRVVIPTFFELLDRED